MATTITQADVAALEAAIKTGAMSVRHGDKTITYQSRESMAQTLAWMKNLLLAPSARRMGGVASWSRNA